MTSLLSRFFGSRQNPHVCQGTTEYNPEYELLVTEFIATEWPTPYSSNLIKTSLYPMLSEPAFNYPSETVMVRVRGLTMTLWETALTHLRQETNTAENQRLLEQLILVIAQREEFNVEYMGWQRTKPNKKNNNKRSKKNLRSVSEGNQSNGGGGGSGGGSGDGPKSGAFDTTKGKLFDQGRRYCRLLENTMIHVTRSMETVETSYTPRRTSLASGSSVSGSIFDSTSGPTYAYSGQLKCYANLLAIAWIRLPHIVPLVVQWICTTLKEVSEEMIVTSVGPKIAKGVKKHVVNSNVTNINTNEETETNFTSSTSTTNTSSSLPSPSLPQTSTPSTPPSSSPQWTPVIHALRRAQKRSLVDTDATLMTEYGMTSYRQSFTHRHPSLFQWRWFYGELRKDLFDALTLEKWVTKLTSDGNFLALFMTALVEHVTEVCKDDKDREKSNANKDNNNRNGYDNETKRGKRYIDRQCNNRHILWDTIPAYWLCIKLYMCLLRQAYTDKLISFGQGNKGFHTANSSITKRKSSNSSSFSSTVSVFRFKIEGPRATNAITRVAKILVGANPYLLDVWIPLCLHHTNMHQHRSVDMSLNHLDQWLEATLETHVPGMNNNNNNSVHTRHMQHITSSMPILIDSIETLLTSVHHRVISSTLSFVYRNLRRIFSYNQRRLGSLKSNTNSVDNKNSNRSNTSNTSNTSNSNNLRKILEMEKGEEPIHESNYYLKLMGTILLSEHFFHLFLHWDHTVRTHYHHILAYRLLTHYKRTDVDLTMDDMIVRTANNLAKLKREKKKQADEAYLLFKANAEQKATEELAAANNRTTSGTSKGIDWDDAEWEKTENLLQPRSIPLGSDDSPSSTFSDLTASSASASASASASQTPILSSSTLGTASPALVAYQEHLLDKTEETEEEEEEENETQMDNTMQQARARAAAVTAATAKAFREGRHNTRIPTTITKDAWGNEIHQKRQNDGTDGTDNDDTVLEIYDALMKRMLIILKEYEKLDSTALDQENIAGDFDDDADMTRGGVPRSRRTYVKRSIEEFATMLKRYYTFAAKSKTGDIRGPSCVVVGVY